MVHHSTHTYRVAQLSWQLRRSVCVSCTLDCVAVALCIPRVVLQVDPGCLGFSLQPCSRAFIAVQFIVHHNWMEGRVGNETSKFVQWLFQCLPQVVSPKFDHLSAQPQVIGEPVNTWLYSGASCVWSEGACVLFACQLEGSSYR